jgi:hypothetical protein
MKIYFIVFIMVNLVFALTNGLCSEQNNGTVCSGTCFGVSTCQFIFDSGKRYCLCLYPGLPTNNTGIGKK